MTERSRDERIEDFYESWGAWDMAERIVDLEDEAATLNAECDRARNAWRSARRRAFRAMGAWRYQDWRHRAQSKEMRKQHEYARWLWDQMSERRQQSDRYRLAWLSARRRAADEVNFATEALALKDAEISRLTSRLEAIRAYADSRVTHPNANEASASWVLHLLDD
ncbi:hypothetical protein ACWC0A_37710 [Streptomyces scopuliridis]